MRGARALGIGRGEKRERRGVEKEQGSSVVEEGVSRGCRGGRGRDQVARRCLLEDGFGGSWPIVGLGAPSLIDADAAKPQLPAGTLDLQPPKTARRSSLISWAGLVRAGLIQQGSTAVLGTSLGTARRPWAPVAPLAWCCKQP